jgi:hypothetical protein
MEENWILSSFILKRVFYTPVNSLRSSSDSFILASSNYQIHTYFIEQYPPSANSKNVASGNAQRLKRAAAAKLQKSRNPEILCVSSITPQTKHFLFFRDAIEVQYGKSEKKNQRLNQRRIAVRVINVQQYDLSCNRLAHHRGK